MGTGDSVTERGWPRLPTTTTCSASSTASSTSSAAVAPAPSATARTVSWKPGSVNVTSYGPGGSPAMTNAPAPSVTATRVGPPGCVPRASTVTPGSASPVASVTAPSTAASWARAAPGARKPDQSGESDRRQRSVRVERHDHVPRCVGSARAGWNPRMRSIRAR